MLHFLSSLSTLNLWVLFMAENLFISAMALLFGRAILKLLKKPFRAASGYEWFIFLVTNIINTVITYWGFWLWLHGFIVFNFYLNWRIASDFAAVFMLMDLCVFIFHYLIHNSAIYKVIHRFHHNYEHPTPIDLFVLHPLETLSFGLMWIVIIGLFSFNFYAICFYLIINLVFGIVGHLGVEPFPAGLRNTLPFKYLGTSSFHHRHHLDIKYNYGFYTNVWDKLFKTYKD